MMTVIENKNESKNRAWREGNVIYFIIADKVTDEEATRLKSAGLQFIAQIVQETGGKASNYIDIQKSSLFSTKARKDWIDYLKNQDVYKTAIVGLGSSRLLEVFATSVISLSEMNNVRYFSDENNAREWFKE